VRCGVVLGRCGGLDDHLHDHDHDHDYDYDYDYVHDGGGELLLWRAWRRE
jgi:hypothetical protein